MNNKKLGIMGGTFDPVHLGHLRTAEFIYEHLGLEKIIFVPAFIAPHKVGLEFAPAADRYRMTELATKPYPYFEVTDIELRRSGVSYTYDTVMELKKQYPEYGLYFIVGADAVPMLNTWHKIRELLSEVTFIAADRPGYGQTIDKVCEFFGEPLKIKFCCWIRPKWIFLLLVSVNVSDRDLPSKGWCPKAWSSIFYKSIFTGLKERRKELMLCLILLK